MQFWTVPQWTGGQSASQPVILMYHSIARLRSDPFGLRVSPRNFAEHMAVIKAHAVPMRLMELVSAMQAGNVPPRAVVVTFDDGYTDNLREAKPILERFGVPATVFVATGYIDSGREPWWDELDRIFLHTWRLPERLTLEVEGRCATWHLNEPILRRMRRLLSSSTWRVWHNGEPTPRQRAFYEAWQMLKFAHPRAREDALDQLQQMTRRASRAGRATHSCLSTEGLRELAAGGLIDIGAHTVMHPCLARLKPHEQLREMVDSKVWLEATLGRAIPTFAYPYGSDEDVSESTLLAAHEAGFAAACTTQPREVRLDDNLLALPRRMVPDCDGAAFAAKLASWMQPSAG